MKTLLTAIVVLCAFTAAAQTNIQPTHPLVENILLGQYDPALYLPSQIISHPDSISQGILHRVSPDSLKSYILQLGSFYNRNSGSDTSSSTLGIGAARKWVVHKFQQFSQQNENRLLPSYLQFDVTICSVNRHKNIFAVLPGTDTASKQVIIMEAHIDSRCEDVCDSLCLAQGIEDNASGTALVMELARVMSAYTYRHTLVFLVTIGEEQGLVGAEAFADYVQQKGILVKAVQNNDITGGIICGQTSSPPSCPGLNDIDSTHVRIFSAGNVNSKHKGYARFMKLEYQEQIAPYTTSPSLILLMSPEDRTGRSGDHVPFRQKNYTAIRLTSANEHGNANSSDTSYTDRQHSYRDTLGIDTDNDNTVDSFFIDFRYLARNTVINGNAAAICAIGPLQPDFTATAPGPDQIIVEVTQATQYQLYRVGVRTTSHDWDTVFTMTGLIDTFAVNSTNNIVYISVLSVDSNGIESIPSVERTVNISGTTTIEQPTGVQLLQNRPNPFDEATYIQFISDQAYSSDAYITITDMQGRVIRTMPIEIQQGMNEVLYVHGYGATGILYYSLIIRGRTVDTKAMVFAN